VSDPIDREQALSAFDTDDNELIIRGSENADAVEQYLKKVMGKIENLPSAQPEPKRGKWILDRSGAYCCSKCMEPCAGYVMMKPRDKFCKMCGSRNDVTE